MHYCESLLKVLLYHENHHEMVDGKTPLPPHLLVFLFCVELPVNFALLLVLLDQQWHLNLTLRTLKVIHLHTTATNPKWPGLRVVHAQLTFFS